MQDSEAIQLAIGKAYATGVLAYVNAYHCIAKALQVYK